jgi:cytochrome b561
MNIDTNSVSLNNKERFIKAKREVRRFTNYFLDLLLLLSIIGTLISGYILWFILPRGIGEHGYIMCQQHGEGLSGNYYTVLNWHRYTWIDIHNWISVFILVLIVLHIIMHWSWIVGICKKIKLCISTPVKKINEQFVAVVSLLILFILDCFSGFVIWLVLPRGEMDYFPMVNGIGRSFLWLQRNIWVDIHAWIAVIIISIVVIHLIFNREWVVAMSRNILKSIVNHTSTSRKHLQEP